MLRYRPTFALLIQLYNRASDANDLNYSEQRAQGRKSQVKRLPIPLLRLLCLLPTRFLCPLLQPAIARCNHHVLARIETNPLTLLLLLLPPGGGVPSLPHDTLYSI